MDYEKAVKNAKWFAVGLLVLAILAFSLSIFNGTLNTLSMFLRFSQIILIIATVKGLNDNQMYGAICGIIVSVLLILSWDIIDVIFGILYLIDCIKLVNYMKN